ncbi:MAG: HNH endonuclease, partial [Bacillota bacterium]
STTRVRVFWGTLQWPFCNNREFFFATSGITLCNSRYFYFAINMHHDDKINPRAVSERIRGLVAEFLAGRPQLHISLAWAVVNNETAVVHIFDGQHKAVAQMLLGARKLPVRVFLNPDLEILLETNTRAGTILRQVAFDKSVQRYLGSQIYWEKIEEFRRATGRNQDDLSFSEQELMAFFKGEHREIKRYILDDVRTAVIHSSENKLRDFIEFGGKSTVKPLSYNTVEKTFFSLFIRKEPMNVPLNYKIELGENPRQLEKTQMVELMNIFAEEIFHGKYDFDRGTYRVEEAIRKGEEITDPHLRAVRMAREEILYNILRYIRDCIKRFYLLNEGRSVEDGDLFQQKFPPLLWEHLQRMVRNFAALPIWINRDATVSSAVFGGKQTYDFWKHIFDSGTTPSGFKVLAKGLTLDILLSA